MISDEQRNLVERHLRSGKNKMVNIVLEDERQVAGIIVGSTRNEIRLADGRRYAYGQIREINGL